jgi:hypothetical protein
VTGVNQPLSPAPAQTRPWRARSDKAAWIVAVVPTLIFLVGIPLHDSSPGTCDAWTGCTASARDQWMWTAQSWATAGIMVGVFVAAAVRIAPWLRVRPTALRRGSITALCVLVPATCVFALILLVVWNADCSETAWLCFSGPSEALALGSPGVVTGAVSALLLLGLARRSTPTRRGVSTATLAGLAAGLVATVAGFAAAACLSLVGVALGAS